MASGFAAFQDEFKSITSSLNRKLQSIHGTSDPQERALLVEEAEGDVYDGKKCLERVERELRHYSYKERTEADSKLRDLRASFEKQQSTLKGLSSGNSSSSSSSGSGANRAYKAKMSRADRANWEQQRQRLLGTQEMVDSMDISLDNTISVIDETVERGIDTTLQLQQQREALIRSQEAINDTDDILTKANKTLRRMRRRVMTNKLIQAVIILLELCIIGLIIYAKYYA